MIYGGSGGVGGGGGEASRTICEHAGAGSIMTNMKSI